MPTLKHRFRRRISRRQLNAFHMAEAVLAAVRSGFPARGMKVLGVTGTKGKTTTCSFAAAILRQAGYTVGMITTAEIRIGDDLQRNASNKSSLHPRELYALLKRMKEAGCTAAVIEVTSHALDQHRVWGVPFVHAGFTNLSHDHLDYHGSMEAYRDAKLKLLRWPKLRTAAANVEDAVGSWMLQHSTAPMKWTCGYADGCDVRATGVHADSRSASFILEAGGERHRVSLKLPGRFNVENALVAAALCLQAGVSPLVAANGLESLELVPGRLERVEAANGATVIIDYAHTPDSLEKLYRTLRPDVSGRMVAVLGATGDRDRTKRPIMGALAARFCDTVFVTDEEPYGEDPRRIMDEVAAGVPRGRPLYAGSYAVDWWAIVPDREEAIARAVALCGPGDVVLLTGMGAQTSKYVGEEKVPWSDRETVERVLAAGSQA